MAQHDEDREMELILTALGFEEPVSKMKQAEVLASERIKNATLVPKFSTVYTGSSAEGFSGDYVLKTSKADFDITISFDRILYIVDQGEDVKDLDTKIPFIVQICHENVPPGYTKLEAMIDEKLALTSKLVVKVENRLFLSSSKALSTLGPSHRKIVGEIEDKNEKYVSFERHGPASTVVFNCSNVGFAKRDLVCGFPCRFWPKYAQNWTTRKRIWPTKELVIIITNEGCHLVPTGFPGSESEDIEWRYSFVKSERRLMWLLNDCQRKCFALLKFLNKEMVAKYFEKETLTSYHLKTTMLWVLEETKPTDWSTENILQCVQFCFTKLLKFVNNRHCPHYFMESLNLLDREVFTEDTCQKLSDVITSILGDPLSALQKCPTIHRLHTCLDSLDLEYLHRCHMSFQWFMCCSRQFDELVSMSGVKFWRTVLGHYNVNKSMGFNMSLMEYLQVMNDDPFQSLYARPFVRLNHFFIGILHHTEISKMTPVDEEDFEIQNLYVEDARDNFVKGFQGHSITPKLRLAIFELMMKELDRADEILKQIDHENAVFLDKEIKAKMSALEEEFLVFISDELEKRSLKPVEIERRKKFVECTYRILQGIFESKDVDHMEYLLELDHKFIEFRPLSWLSADVIFLPEEISCVPFPFQVELAAIKAYSLPCDGIKYHPKTLTLALKCLVSVAQNDRESAKFFCRQILTSLESIGEEYDRVLILNLVGGLLLKLNDFNDAWETVIKAVRLSRSNMSSFWLLGLLLSKKFRD